jgi:mRNA interferase RelE/StbE
MMDFSIRLTPKVRKFIDKQPSDISDRIKKKLESLKSNPYRFLEHYEGADYHKLRIGDYRALIDVDMARGIIFVRFIDHRSRIYNRI